MMDNDWRDWVVFCFVVWFVLVANALVTASTFFLFFNN